MPKLFEQGKFDLALLYGGFVEALEGWAAYQADPAGHANTTKGGLAARLCFDEGLCSPLQPITKNEADALRNIISFLEKAKTTRLAVSEVKCSQMIETFIKDADQAPGWLYLKKAFSTDKAMPMVIPTNKGLAATRPSVLQESATLRDAEAVFSAEAAKAGDPHSNPGGYDTVILEDVQPGMTVNEYETAQMKIWDPPASRSTGIGAGAGGGGAAGNPGMVGDPAPPNDPFKDPAPKDPFGI